MDGFYNLKRPQYNYSDSDEDDNQKIEEIKTIEKPSNENQFQKNIEEPQLIQHPVSQPSYHNDYNEVQNIQRNTQHFVIEEGIQEIQKIGNQMFQDYDYLYEEKANLVDDFKVKKEDFSNFMQIVKPERQEYTVEEIKTSKKIIDSATENDNNFIMKVLQAGLQQEEVQLIAKKEITQNEDRSLAQLLNGNYSQKQMIEIKFPDTKQQNYKKLASSKKEKDNFVSKFQQEIAKGYNLTHPKNKIKPEQVCIFKIEEGSIRVHFIIKDEKGNPQTVSQEEMSDVTEKAGFKNCELKLHPFLKYCTLSPQQFDVAGNIDFTITKARQEQRGGLVYNQPDQWKRYGLKVTGQFKNSKGKIDDSWLHDWTNGWAVAYHGFSETRGSNRSQSQKLVNHGINSIITEGFIPGTGQAYKGAKDIKTGKPITEGVYFSNKVEDAESYCSFIDIPEDPNFKYKIAFTCRVNPKAVQFATENYYVIKNKQDIRPYGILLKKYPK